MGAAGWDGWPRSITTAQAGQGVGITMNALLLAETLREVYAVASDVADERHHDQLDTAHLLYVLLRDTEAGYRWRRAAGLEDGTELLKALSEALNTWFHSGSEHAEPTVEYVEACRSAETIAQIASASQIDASHLLKAILENDQRMRQWVREQGFDLAAVELEVQTPLLDSLGRNLTELAAQGDLATVIGRDEEVEKLIEVLLRRGKSNAILLGPPGTGKTAIVEKLAQRIVAKDVPPKLHFTEIVELSAAALVAGTTYRGQFEERVQQLIDELQRSGSTILVLDEFHTVVGAGTTIEGGPDIANILKPALARGEIRCIGITTDDEYRRSIEKDKALVRRFSPIQVAEPSSEEALEILHALRSEFEEHHGVEVDEDALDAIIKWTERYLASRHFPDKAIDVMATAASRAEIQKRGRVDVEMVAQVLSDMLGIPVGELDIDIKRNLLQLEQRLNAQVIGQQAAIHLVSKAVRIAYADLKDPARPRAVFLFAGPSGVGKTQLARCLADELFGSESNLVRLDMSEYAERINVSRLIGAAPGYIGYDEPGQLTQPLRERPYSVVLLDEVEKAHPDVFDLFLQLFDEGRLTDSHGNIASGRNAIFIMTTNLAAAGFQGQHLGFGSQYSIAHEQALDSELRRFFRPEFLNRIDHIVVFQPLHLDDLEEIARIELDKLERRLSEKGIRLSYEAEVARIIAQQAATQSSGARAIARVVEDLIVAPISDELLSLTGPDKEWIHVLVHSEQITLEWI